MKAAMITSIGIIDSKACARACEVATSMRPMATGRIKAGSIPRIMSRRAAVSRPQASIRACTLPIFALEAVRELSKSNSTLLLPDSAMRLLKSGGITSTKS